MENLINRRKKATPRGIGIVCSWFAQKAKNATIWDTNGKEYIDFASGIAVLNVGHCHTRVIDAIKRQLDHFTHTAYQVTPYESYIELAEKINALAPIDGEKKSCFFTTGGEATENAVKIAKAYTKRYGVISFGGSFHGRTGVAMSMTGKVAPYKSDFGVSMVGIYHGLYPNTLHNVSVDDSIRSLEHLCRSSISPNDIAAIIFEPVQGEGGFNVAPKDFVKKLRSFCDEHGIVLIADEVQTGFGRTGKLFAMEYFDSYADIICMAKSLGGGIPISGVVGKANIMDAPNAGGLGGTYAGSPLGTVAGLEVLKIIEEEKLLDRANELGNTLKETLANLNCKHIAEIRGLGSMVAVEFFKDGVPHGAYAKEVQAKAMERGLLLLSCGVYGNVIRFLYPLTIPKEQFQKALEILKEVILELK